MKKIMFKDKYGLTDAVLQGRKTMTRRLIKQLLNAEDPDISDWGLKDGGKAMITLYEGGRPTTDIFPMYQPGEVVAVAQSYKDLGYTKEWVEQHISPNPHAKPSDPFEKKYPGWNNKMFVPSDLCPSRIRITDIKVERLQDITAEDCLKEGIYRWKDMEDCPKSLNEIQRNRFGYYGGWDAFSTPRKAFADLIDKPGVGGKGTWKRNPFVFAYTFELIK